MKAHVYRVVEEFVVEVEDDSVQSRVDAIRAVEEGKVAGRESACSLVVVIPEQ